MTSSNSEKALDVICFFYQLKQKGNNLVRRCIECNQTLHLLVMLSVVVITNSTAEANYFF